MSPVRLPEELRYTETHEWVRSDGEELVVGITDYAQGELTDIVFVDLPKGPKDVRAAEAVLVLESVKTVSDVYAPIAGAVVTGNAELKAHPELVNKDPYGAGWLYRLKPSTPYDPSKLLTADAYRAKFGLT
ncbi:MAG TPA: glycine cleavage system protein GcvH [Thermoplasmata archaeon]|nr:glycine cleavage system protein GcvH [Thermoplasmata archaeon]